MFVRMFLIAGGEITQEFSSVNKFVFSFTNIMCTVVYPTYTFLLQKRPLTKYIHVNFQLTLYFLPLTITVAL